MARIPYVDPESAPADVRAVFERLPAPLHVFRLLAHAESDFRPLIQLGSAILGRQALPARWRELAILHVARLSGADYEWIQHLPLAQASGASTAQIRALEREDLEADVFDAAERAVLRFTGALVRGVKAAPEVFAEAHRQLGDRQLVELIVTVGYYGMLARLMENLEIDPDPPVGARFLDALR